VSPTPAVAAVVLVLVTALRGAVTGPNTDRWTPIVAAALGTVVGAGYAVSQGAGWREAIGAALNGAVAGLGAVGAHQAGKQLRKSKE